MNNWINNSIFVLLCFHVVFGQNVPHRYYLPPVRNNRYLNSNGVQNENDLAVLGMGSNGISFSKIPLTLNSSCLITDTNDVGNCFKKDDCPSSERILTFRRPPICFYIGFTPVLCCPEFEDRSAHRKRNRPSSNLGQLIGAGAAPGQCSASTGMSERMCEKFHSRNARSKRELRYQFSQNNFFNQISRVDEYYKSFGSPITSRQDTMIFEDTPPLSVSPPFDDPPETKALYIAGESAPAGQGEFLHMAALGWLHQNSLSFDCGGFLVDRGYVVTAAHCLKIGKPDYVRLGGVRIDDNSIQAGDIPVVSYVVHPSYTSLQVYYDIAILRLGRCAPSTVVPACLWTQNMKVDYRMEAIGYGVTDVSTQAKSNILLKIELESRANNFCKNVFRRHRGKQPRGIVEEQLCAGYPMMIENPPDTCNGDSGGPLGMKMQKSYADRNVPYVMGITSFGVPSCNAAYSVYTRVSSYVCWIEQNVWLSSTYSNCN